MGWALALLPDEAGQRTISRLWLALRQEGFHSPLYEGESLPHLSLALLQTQDGSLPKRAEKLAAAFSPIDVTMAGTAAFGREVLYLAPQPLGALLAAHRQAVAALGPLVALCDGHYLPGAWTPHLSLAVNLEGHELARADRVMAKHFAPFACRLTELAVIKYHPAVVVARHALAAPPGERTP